MIYDEILPLLIFLMIAWVTTFVVAMIAWKAERKNKNKVVSFWKGIMFGLLICIAANVILPFVISDTFANDDNAWAETGFYGIGTLAGILGNIGMIYYYKSSPSRELYERKKVVKQEIKEAKDAAREEKYFSKK